MKQFYKCWLIINYLIYNEIFFAIFQAWWIELRVNLMPFFYAFRFSFFIDAKSNILIQQVCQSVSDSDSGRDVLVTNFFSTPPIKLKLQVGGKLLIATHLDQSNVLTLFIRLFQGSSMALKAVDCLRVPAVSPWIHWI